MEIKYSQKEMKSEVINLIILLFKIIFWIMFIVIYFSYIIKGYQVEKIYDLILIYINLIYVDVCIRLKGGLFFDIFKICLSGILFFIYDN